MVASVRSIESGSQLNQLGCFFAACFAAKLWQGLEACLKSVFSRIDGAQFALVFRRTVSSENNRGLSLIARQRAVLRRSELGFGFVAVASNKLILTPGWRLESMA